MLRLVGKTKSNQKKKANLRHGEEVPLQSKPCRRSASISIPYVWTRRTNISMSNQLPCKCNTFAFIDKLNLLLAKMTAIEYIRNAMKRVWKKESPIILACQNDRRLFNSIYSKTYQAVVFRSDASIPV